MEIGGHALRIACGSARLANRIGNALQPHLIDTAAPLGFSLQPPSGRQRFYLVLDRCGFILSRTKTAEQAMAVLGQHLSAFLPPVHDALQFRLRALEQSSGVTICLWPLTFAQPLIERKLERVGGATIDRLGIDLNEAGHVLNAPPPWPELSRLSAGPGHAISSMAALPVIRILWPYVGGRYEPRATRAGFLAALANSFLGDRRDIALQRCSRLVSGSELVHIDMNESDGIYRALAK